MSRAMLDQVPRRLVALLGLGLVLAPLAAALLHHHESAGAERLSVADAETPCEDAHFHAVGDGHEDRCAACALKQGTRLRLSQESTAALPTPDGWMSTGTVLAAGRLAATAHLARGPPVRA